MRNLHTLGLFTLLLGQVCAGTLPQHALQAYDCERCSLLAREELQASWPLNNATLNHEVMHEQSSKKFSLQVSLAQLQHGVTINTLAPGAVIRIVAQHPNQNVAFRIQKGSAQDLSLAQASALYADQEALQNTVFNSEHQMLIQLKPELGAGSFQLSASGNGAMLTDQFTIHVYDRASSTRLTVKTDKPRYYYGDELTATIRLADDDNGYPADKIKAILYTADGRDYPLNVESVGLDTFQAKMTLKDEKNPLGGNFYIDVEVLADVKGLAVQRQAHTAFSYVIPSAAVTEIKTEFTQSLNLSATIMTATASRYALQAVLFATDAKGKRVTVENVQNAQWFDVGTSTMNVDFSTKLAQYQPPFYLGEIRLLDYGQMKPVFEYNTLIPIPITGNND